MSRHNFVPGVDKTFAKQIKPRISSHLSVCLLLKSQNALRGSWEEAEREGGAWKAEVPLPSGAPASYPSLDVQGGLWALMGGGGMEAITREDLATCPPGRKGDL